MVDVADFVKNFHDGALFLRTVVIVVLSDDKLALKPQTYGFSYIEPCRRKIRTITIALIGSLMK